MSAPCFLTAAVGVCGILLGAWVANATCHREARELLAERLRHRPQGSLVWIPSGVGQAGVAASLAGNFGSDGGSRRTYQGVLQITSGERVSYYYPAQNAAAFGDLLVIRVEGGSGGARDVVLHNGVFGSVFKNAHGTLIYRAE